MNLPMSLSFEYEVPGRSSHGRMRTPVSIYYTGLKRGKKTSGILAISDRWLEKNKLDATRIAMQVKGKLDTYIIFNPPSNAPCFYSRSMKNGHQRIFTATNSLDKILDVFNLNRNKVNEMWLEPVGVFGNANVYRLRNLNENDKLYDF
jgi:hypothetical protein